MESNRRLGTVLLQKGLQIDLERRELTFTVADPWGDLRVVGRIEGVANRPARAGDAVRIFLQTRYYDVAPAGTADAPAGALTLGDAVAASYLAKLQQDQRDSKGQERQQNQRDSEDPEDRVAAVPDPLEGLLDDADGPVGLGSIGEGGAAGPARAARGHGPQRRPALGHLLRAGAGIVLKGPGVPVGKNDVKKIDRIGITFRWDGVVEPVPEQPNGSGASGSSDHIKITVEGLDPTFLKALAAIGCPDDRNEAVGRLLNEALLFVVDHKVYVPLGQPAKPVPGQRRPRRPTP